MYRSKQIYLALLVPVCLFLGACSVAEKTSNFFGGSSKSSEPLLGAGLAATDEGDVKAINDILFAPGSSQLPDQANYVVTDIVQYMLKNRRQTASINGHTDANGFEKNNMDLSVQRAFNVRNAIIAAGIPAHRLEPVGYGETRPVASNESVDGRKANRRVEIVFPD